MSEVTPSPNQSLERYSDMADELEQIIQAEPLQFNKEVIRWIVEDLRNGDIQAVRINCEQQSDKFGDGNIDTNPVKAWLFKHVFDSDMSIFPWRPFGYELNPDE